MRKEAKDILHLFLIAIPACIFIYVWWLHSPMKQEVWEREREQALFYLAKTHWFYPDPGKSPDDREAMMKYYHIAEEDGRYFYIGESSENSS